MFKRLIKTEDVLLTVSSDSVKTQQELNRKIGDRLDAIEQTLQSISSLLQRQSERMTDIEKDIKLTWDYLKVTKDVIPAKDKEYKLNKK